MADPGENRSYAAFISYRHLPLDRKWAEWLLESLERFRTPRSLVRKGFPARIAPIYRDEDEVPASADLGRHIEQALEASRALIVVCTPATPASRWIDREVRLFQQLGRGERIHVLLADGEPDDAFPRALLETEEREPVAADVRPRPDASERKLRHMGRLRLAAALLGCAFDDLRRRERQRTRRRVLTVLLLALLALGTAGWLTVGYLRRQENVRLAEGMAEAERSLIERGLQGEPTLRAALAFDLLADRNPLGAPIPAAVTRALLPVARLGAVRPVPLGRFGAPTRLRPRPGYVLVGTDAGALLRVLDGGGVSLVSPGGCPVGSQPFGCAVTAIAERDDRQWAIGIVGGMVRRGGPTGISQWIQVSPQRLDHLAWLADGALLAVDGAGRLYRIAADGSVGRVAEAGGAVTALLREGDHRIVLIRARGTIERLQPDGSLATIGRFSPRLEEAAFVRGRMIVLRRPPAFSVGGYRTLEESGSNLLRLEGGRWNSIPIPERIDVEPPDELYAVSPDAAYTLLGLVPEPEWGQDYRRAVIGLARLVARAPTGRYFYRIGSAGLAIVDLERLWRIEDLVRSGGYLRRVLCGEGLAPLFTHRLLRPRPCAP